MLGTFIGDPCFSKGGGTPELVTVLSGSFISTSI